MKEKIFWETLENLASTGKLIIDRPKGKPHPRYPDLIYPLDYGYMEGTVSGDGHGIDVWVGSLGERTLTGIICTYDTGKRDAEVKLLLGCTTQDIETIVYFNDVWMRYLFIPNPIMQNNKEEK